MTLSEKLNITYNVSKKSFDENLSKKDAKNRIFSKGCMAESSAKMYIDEYYRMRNGEKLAGTMSDEAYAYYFENIEKDNGVEGLKKLLESTKLYISSSKKKKTKNKIIELYHSYLLHLPKEYVSNLENCELNNIEIKETKNSSKEKLLHICITFKNGRKRECIDTIQMSAKFIMDSLRTLDKGYMCLTEFETQKIYLKHDINFGLKTKEKDALHSVFISPESKMYQNPERCFQESVFDIFIPNEKWNGTDIFIPSCKLTNQWCNNFPKTSEGNYLWALVELTNEYYSDFLEIKFLD